MVPLSDPGNLGLVVLLTVILGIPLSLLAFGIFLAVRRIPSLVIQCLVPLVAGIMVSVTYAWMDPSHPGNSGILMFLMGMAIHPLLILPPIIIMQKYLRRIPVLYAVFFTAFIASGFLIAWSALQGDMRVGEPENIVGQSIRAVITDILIASGASGLILGLDRFLTGSEKKNS